MNQIEPQGPTGPQTTNHVQSNRLRELLSHIRADAPPLPTQDQYISWLTSRYIKLIVGTTEMFWTQPNVTEILISYDAVFGNPDIHVVTWPFADLCVTGFEPAIQFVGGVNTDYNQPSYAVIKVNDYSKFGEFLRSTPNIHIVSKDILNEAN